MKIVDKELIMVELITIALILSVAGIVNYCNSKDEAQWQTLPDIGCITDTECGCLDDCFAPLANVLKGSK